MNFDKERLDAAFHQGLHYSKTCLKRLLKKKTEIGFQDGSSLKCRSKVLQNTLLQHSGEHSAILSTFIKLPFVLRPLFCLFFSGSLRQVLLYLLEQN